MNTLYMKFYAHMFYMFTWNFFGVYAMMNCSYFRLNGVLDNGLRWKNSDITLKKYDFTKDFEEQSIFKYLRQRVEKY